MFSVLWPELATVPFRGSSSAPAMVPQARQKSPIDAIRDLKAMMTEARSMADEVADLGSIFEASHTASAPAEEAEPPVTRSPGRTAVSQCRHCGSGLERSWRFCHVCGVSR